MATSMVPRFALFGGGGAACHDGVDRECVCGRGMSTKRVGWHGCALCNGRSSSRLPRTLMLPPQEFRTRLHTQARTLSRGGLEAGARAHLVLRRLRHVSDCAPTQELGDCHLQGRHMRLRVWAAEWQRVCL